MYKIKLSPFQKIFFNDWQIDPNRSDYNIVSDQFLQGKLYKDKLNLAIQKFVNEYVLLNSRIELIDNEPMWVRTSYVAKLDFFDNPISERDIYNYVSQPFDLTRNRLYRFLLICYAKNKYRFIVVFHHILVASFSAEQSVFEILMNHYRGNISHPQYSHNAQISLLNSLADTLELKLNNNLKQSKNFWLDKFNEVETIDFKFLCFEENKEEKKNLSEVVIQEYRFDLDAQLVGQTKQLMRKYKITVYLFGQIIFAYLLYRHTGQKRFAISYPFAIKEGSEFIYGAQINTSFILYDFNDIEYFSDIVFKIKIFIKEVKNKGGFDHRYCPVSEIINISNKGFLDVAFIQTNLKDILFKFDSIESIKINQELNIDLNNKLLFEQELKDEKIKFRVKYRKDEVNSNLLTQFIDCYKRVYSEILKDECEENIRKPLRNYSILSPVDYDKIFHRWNDTKGPYPRDKTIHELFEAQVRVTPDNIALTYEDKQLTYKELNVYANQLASYLKKQHKIQPDELIGICLGKSEYWAIAIFGVLKSGAAYVPIDPNYPHKRIEYILEDIKAKAILTTEMYLAKLNGIILSLDHSNTSHSTDILALDLKNTLKILENENSANLKCDNQSHNLAYVIYTSGTTGVPKGVMIEHRNLVAFITGFVQFPLNNMMSRNMLSVTNYVFDIFALEFFLPLLSGYNLHLFDLMVPKKKIKMNHYDCFQVTPSTLELLVDNIDYQMSRLKGKHTIKGLIGGEMVTLSAINQLRQLESNLQQSGIDIHFEIINVYGPTETTIWSVAGCIDVNNLSSGSKLGYPLRNQSVYILDEELNPLPIGTKGEIYIGGSGVSRGYLHNMGLTNEKFISNPFLVESDENSERDFLYKTGDLGRWHPEGVIEFLGRKDSQIKLYGHRVELTEIESRLDNYPGIKQSTVVILRSEKNTPYLLAYYTADKKISEEKIQSYLSEYLPSFMQPNKFFYLSKFPLTPSGKIDRNKLAIYDLNSLIENSYVAPRNKLEAMICKVFSDSLKVKAGLYDDFFKLGGTSLSAIQVVSRLRKDFNFSIEVSDILKYKTVAQLISNIHFFKKTHYGPEVNQGNKTRKSVLSLAQERLWILSQYQNSNRAYNVPFTFKLKPRCNKETLIKSLESVMNRHEILRTIIKKDKQGNIFPQVLSAKIDVDILSVDTKKKLHSFLQENIEHIFDLNQELPIKIWLYHYKNEYYMSMVIHHIAFDGWSGDILAHDLMFYYNYYSQNGNNTYSVALSNIPIQYTDFAIWHKSYLGTKEIAEQAEFWQKKLQYYEPLNLPIDKHRPMVFDYRGKAIAFSLPLKLSVALRECAKTLGISLYSLMLSAFYLLLRIYSNQNDIVLGTMVSNRHYKNVESLVGFFVNMLVLRQQIESKNKLIDFIYSVFDEVIEAQQNQDLPFDKLVDKLNIPKNLSQHPVFQVVFGVQNFGSGYQDLLVDYPHIAMRRTAKFDFSLILNDSHEKLQGTLEYATSLFEEETIQGYIKTYQIILQQLSNINEPKFKDKCIKDVSYLDEKNHKKNIDKNSLNIVVDWKSIYDLTYSRLNIDNNNFIGWNSSYTGKPISLEQMHEWQNETLNKINQLPVKRVLEIGSGSGLLLYELIKKSLFYYAFDFSEKAIDYSQKNIDALGYSKKFQGCVAAADEIEFKNFFEKYDTVILNSVIQYFPSVEYLENVLIKVITNVSDPGQIFIGDVRDFRLLECFAYSVVDFRKEIVTVFDVEYFKTKEKELLVAPEYFLSLKRRFKTISWVEFLPKLGNAMNEMNGYRYDVILHINKYGGNSVSLIGNDQFKKTIDINSVFKNETQQSLFIKYPNNRIAQDYSACEKLYHHKYDIDIGDTNKLLSISQLTKIFKKHAYKIKLYLDIENPLFLNIIAYKNAGFLVENTDIDYPEINLEQKIFSNKPLRNKMLMGPRHLTFIDKTQINDNGKLDYNFFLKPEFNPNKDYAPPNSKLERFLCKTFSKILNIEEGKVGIRDNFFQLGGNSILAIKLVYRINNQLKYNLEISDIFLRNTVQDLASYLSDIKSKLDDIIALNHIEDKLNMFMVHPAFANSEVYADLAQKFSNKYNCYGLDNYNLKHHKKIEDIKELAEKYLATIRHIRKQTHQENEPYVFLGWSLGGQIALNMANILEQEGVKNIYLILIDSVYPDTAFSVLLSQVLLDQTQLKIFAQQIGLEKKYVTKVKNNFQYDIKLSSQKKKIKLEHSKLLLFKAMKKEAVIFLKNYDPLKEYVVNLASNNLDKAVDGRNIYLVQLHDSNHFNLLEQEEVIYKNTMSFIDE